MNKFEYIDENGELLTKQDIQKQYQRMKKDNVIQEESFNDFLENCLSKNGSLMTIEWAIINFPQILIEYDQIFDQYFNKMKNKNNKLNKFENAIQYKESIVAKNKKEKIIMKQNVRIAKQLIKIAKNLIANEQDETCQICNNHLNKKESFYTDDHDFICYDCATKLALQAKQKNKEIQITSGYDSYYLCNWCQQLFPKNELKQEINLGYICNSCIQGIASHGQPLYIKYN